MIDSHTHLDRGPGSEAQLVADAHAVGVNRILTIGMDRASCRAALAAADAHSEVYAALGRHPNSATGFDERDLADVAELARHPKCRAIGETGLDFYRDGAPRDDQVRAFEAHITLARDTGKPLVVHSRAAAGETLEILKSRALGLDVILHCFSMPERLGECLEQDWILSFAGNVTYPKSEALALACEQVPLDRLLVETDAPYLTPQALRKLKNQPAYVTETAGFVAQRRGIAYGELEAAVEATASRLFAW